MGSRARLSSHFEEQHYLIPTSVPEDRSKAAFSSVCKGRGREESGLVLGSMWSMNGREDEPESIPETEKKKKKTTVPKI